MKLALVFFALVGSLAACIGTPADISVMTFNIRYDNPRDGVDAWPNRANWVADVIRKADVDIFGIQESLRHQVDTLSVLLADYDWVGVGRDDGADRGEFAPIFYKPEVLELQTWVTLWLSETPSVAGSVGWDAALPRIATRATFKVVSTGAQLQFVNVHMDHRGVQARTNASKLLADSLSDAGATVLVGDFNFADTTAAYQAILGGGLMDSFVAAQRPAPEPTFTGFDASSEPGGRIDYIFTNRASVLSYLAMDETKNGRYLSDHRPVIAQLRVRN